LPDTGWRPCLHENRCKRAGKCLRLKSSDQTPVQARECAR
jgi:hypothetical protein